MPSLGREFKGELIMMKSMRIAFLFIIFSWNYSNAATTIFNIGNRNSSDAEFDQSGYSLDYYPLTQLVSQCPKELNLYNYTSQYFNFNLSSAQVSSDLMMVLIPAWSNGTGLLKIKLEIWNNNGNWVEIDSTYVNSKDSSYLEIPRGYLYSGSISMRLVAVSGTGGTNVVTWDQIKLYTIDQDIIFSLGTNNNNSSEFKQNSFTAVWTDAQTVAQFPKELNTTWWTTQYINFTLSSARSEKSAYFSFDTRWNDGSGTLTVAIDYWSGSTWVESRRVNLAKGYSNRIEIPSEHLKEGLNEMRLRAVSGTNGTAVIQWDQITLWQRTVMPEPMKEVLNEVVNTTLNYWLNSNVIHTSGLPLTAYKSTDRARFGYSNPTEWGHALQAWLVAAQFGKISNAEAVTKIQNALNSMLSLQADPSQFAYGLFYPYYTLVNPNGSNNAFPVNDGDARLPSGDCALLWGSIWVVEGWLKSIGEVSTAQLASQVRANMSFANCYYSNQSGHFFAHQINASTGQLSSSNWNVFSDEGGVVNFIAYLAGSINLAQYQQVHNYQLKSSSSWNGHTVDHAGYFNTAFVWPQRMFIGYPIEKNQKARQYLEYSFNPNFRAHLDWVSARNVQHMGFSDSMTQTSNGQAMVGGFVAPNLASVTQNNLPAHVPNPLKHVQPHGVMVPFLAYGSLDMTTLKKIFEHLLLLKNDSEGYWHDTGTYPYGFEVTASAYLDDTGYSGTDDGRNIFESLSQAYTLFPVAYALQKENGWSNFYDYAQQVDASYAQKVQDSLDYTFSNPKP